MKMEKIGVLTSGGDVPGLNAALHAIVLAATKRGVQVMGINNGYEGLIDGSLFELNAGMVQNIMDEGGTILHTSRSKRFTLKSGRKQAYAQLERAGIDGLIVIGGNGSLLGAEAFSREFNYPLVVVPKTIDNDVYGTDYALGFDTALNTIVQAIDKIKDTADSTSRIFIVEVMGRKAGFLALHSGIAVGANAIIVPEIKPDLQKLLTYTSHNWHIGNRAMIIVITENVIPNGGFGLKKLLDAKIHDLDSRVTVLGHVQRGGSPSAFDRTLASLLGYKATVALLKGRTGTMAGYVNGKVQFTGLAHIAGKCHKLNGGLLALATEYSILI